MEVVWERLSFDAESAGAPHLHLKNMAIFNFYNFCYSTPNVHGAKVSNIYNLVHSTCSILFLGTILLFKRKKCKNRFFPI